MAARDTILIIEDDTVFSTILCKIVKKAGLKTLTAFDGEEGISMMQQHADTISAVLLDIHMPEVDGISVLGQFKTNQPDIPVMIISGSQNMAEIAEAAKNWGAAGYIQKSNDAEALESILGRFLEGL